MTDPITAAIRRTIAASEPMWRDTAVDKLADEIAAEVRLVADVQAIGAPQPATTDDTVDDVLAYLMSHVTPHEAEIVAHTWAENIVRIAQGREAAKVREQALRDATAAVDAVEFDDNDAGAHDALWLAHLAVESLAARGDAATPTVTEWGVRVSNGTVQDGFGSCDEAASWAFAVEDGALMQRTVSAWREVTP